MRFQSFASIRATAPAGDDFIGQNLQNLVGQRAMQAHSVNSRKPAGPWARRMPVPVSGPFGVSLALPVMPLLQPFIRASKVIGKAAAPRIFLSGLARGPWAVCLWWAGGAC